MVLARGRCRWLRTIVGNANVAVATVSAALLQWNIRSDVFVSVMDRQMITVD